MRGGWGLRNLMRHPLRTALSLAGIAVAAAMLLDMVMLSGGIERSFAELLLSRGYQIRVTPAGTLPFDAEATIPAVRSVRDSLRADPSIAAAGAILGGSIYAHRGDSLLTLFAYGVEPEAQGIYQLVSGRDLEPGDVRGILLSSFAASAHAPRSRAYRAGIAASANTPADPGAAPPIASGSKRASTDGSCPTSSRAFASCAVCRYA